MKKAARKSRASDAAPGSHQLESWASLANESAQVVASRLALLPWMWLGSPVTAQAETQRMFSEKQDAMAETQVAMWHMPMQFWADALANDLMLEPDKALQTASNLANQRLIGPSHKRVSANRKRLNKPQ